MRTYYCTTEKKRVLNIIFEGQSYGFFPFFLAIGGSIYAFHIIQTAATDELSSEGIDFSMILGDDIFASKSIIKDGSNTRLKLPIKGEQYASSNFPVTVILLREGMEVAYHTNADA